MRSIIEWLEANQIPCYFKKTFGFECLGCGLQSSFILLLKGEFYNSFITYPALIPVLFLLVFFVIHLFLKFKKGKYILKISLIFTLSIQVISYVIRHGFLLISN